MDVTKITIEELEKMTEQEWQAFRQAAWAYKQEYHKSTDVPSWYLNSQENFAKYLELKNSKK